jgi:hypothetical protein
MKKLAVCTVGVVLALLLGGLSSVDQIHSAVGTGASVVYAAQSATAPACLEIGTSTPGVVTEWRCRFYFHCTVSISPGGEISIECEIGIECDF